MGRNLPVEYRNDYIDAFAFDHGKVLRWREYDNPMLSAAMVAEFVGDIPVVVTDRKAGTGHRVT